MENLFTSLLALALFLIYRSLSDTLTEGRKEPANTFLLPFLCRKTPVLILINKGPPMRLVCAIFLCSGLLLGVGGLLVAQEHHFGNDRDKAALGRMNGVCRCGAECKCGRMPAVTYTVAPTLPKKVDDFLDRWEKVPDRLESVFWGAGLLTGAVGGLVAGLGLGLIVGAGRKTQ